MPDGLIPLEPPTVKAIGWARAIVRPKWLRRCGPTRTDGVMADQENGYCWKEVCVMQACGKGRGQEAEVRGCVLGFRVPGSEVVGQSVSRSGKQRRRESRNRSSTPVCESRRAWGFCDQNRRRKDRCVPGRGHMIKRRGLGERNRDIDAVSGADKPDQATTQRMRCQACHKPEKKTKTDLLFLRYAVGWRP